MEKQTMSLASYPSAEKVSLSDLDSAELDNCRLVTLPEPSDDDCREIKAYHSDAVDIYII
jgi:hypothetical protein